jgi:alcohol dehydrogenase, propanol-preferring
MLAARLHPGASQLVIEDVPVPEPAGDAVLVRVAGAGVCRSDLHVLDGRFEELVRRPVTMGHEIAGRVAALGPSADGVEIGEPVAVMVGWGCGFCRWCVSGHEQLCAEGREAGSTADGGFAEYVLVPHRRHLVPLGDLDCLEATPLGCAALSAYAAVKRVRPHLDGAATLVIIGAGGLGQFAVQLSRALSGAVVVVVDTDAEALARAKELGADHVLSADEGAAPAVLEVSSGGADAVLDFVGTDATLALAADVVAPRGIVALLGLAGGTLPFEFFRLAPEASVTTVVAGTVRDLQEVVALAGAGRVRSRVRTYALTRIHDALDDLRGGLVDGRAVVVPDQEGGGP